MKPIDKDVRIKVGESLVERIQSINKLLNMSLDIPDYQRPYKWTIQNITELLEDIKEAIENAERYRGGFKYRIGTIIVHDYGNDKYDVVDGQQRIISLSLIKLYLEPDYKSNIINK